MMPLPTLRPHSLCALLLGLCVMTFSATATAQQSAKLLPYAPGGSGVVAGFDVKGSRDSALFKQAMKMAGQNRKFKDATAELQAKAGISLERDIDALLFLAPAPRGASAAKQSPFTLVLQGKFDPKKIAVALSKEKVKDLGKGKHFLLKERSELFLASDNLMVLTHGPDAYRKGAITQAKSAKKTGLSGGMQKHVGQLDTKKHVWMALDASGIKGGRQGDISLLLLQGDLSSGVALEGSMLFKDADDAKRLIESFENNRTKVSMGTAMIGAPSVGSTMKLTQAGKKLAFSMKVPESEVIASLGWLENYENTQRTRAKMRKEQEAKEEDAVIVAPGK